MGQSNWTFSDDGLDAGTVDRGVTTGIAPPPGGGSSTFGFNSLALAQGAVGLFTNQVNFAPMAKGGRITGALCRLPSGGPIGFSVFLYICAQGPSVNDTAYLLGLSDDDPHHITLRKGAIVAGLPSSAPGTNGILRRSTATYPNNTWLHLLLDAVVNTNGDVILRCAVNDLSLHPIGTSPVWAPIPGMSDFIDDTLQINTGSASLTSGRAGWGYATKDVTRRAAVDEIVIERQL